MFDVLLYLIAIVVAADLALFAVMRLHGWSWQVKAPYYYLPRPTNDNVSALAIGWGALIVLSTGSILDGVNQPLLFITWGLLSLSALKTMGNEIVGLKRLDRIYHLRKMTTPPDLKPEEIEIDYITFSAITSSRLDITSVRSVKKEREVGSLHQVSVRVTK